LCYTFSVALLSLTFLHHQLTSISRAEIKQLAALHAPHKRNLARIYEASAHSFSAAPRSRSPIARHCRATKIDDVISTAQTANTLLDW